MPLTLPGRSFIKIQYSSFPLFPVAYPFRIATNLQYYVKRKKCKVNDVIFPSGSQARPFNPGNKNVIFTGASSVRSKNIFTDNFRYPTGKHEINRRNWLYRAISPLPTVFSTLLENFLHFSSNMKLLFGELPALFIKY